MILNIMIYRVWRIHQRPVISVNNSMTKKLIDGLTFDVNLNCNNCDNQDQFTDCDKVTRIPLILLKINAQDMLMGSRLKILKMKNIIVSGGSAFSGKSGLTDAEMYN